MSAAIRRSVLYSQNFLKDPRLVASLLDKSSLNCQDVVYEIGPGKGMITEQLVLRYPRVIAIEKDSRLASLLQRKFVESPHLTVHTGDFLHYNLPLTPYKVFANIPFNITSEVVKRLTAATCPPEDAYLVMQKEAAHMFLGQPRECLRSLLLKPWFELEIVHHFHRKDFTPVPRVDVVMLRLRKRGPPLINPQNRQSFRDFIIHIFTTWQPGSEEPLKSIFSKQQRAYIQKVLGIEIGGSPTAMPFREWLKLFEYFKEVSSKGAMQVIAGSEKRLLRQQSNLQKMHRTRSSPA